MLLELFVMFKVIVDAIVAEEVMHILGEYLEELEEREDVELVLKKRINQFRLFPKK